MTTVNKILNLFDDLDAYESVELIKELAARGYELIINRKLEETHKKKTYGLFLKSYETEYKITTIKTIRNMAEDFKKLNVTFWNEEIGLKEAKEFVESHPHRWKIRPLAWGEHNDLELLQKMIKHKYEEYGAEFEINEILASNL